MINTNNRTTFEKQHLYYQKRAYTLLIKEFRSIFKTINFDDIESARVELYINEIAIENVLRKLYLDVGLKYGKHVVRNLEDEKKALKPFPLFSERFLRFINDFLRNKGGEKVVSITKTMTESVLSVIRSAQLEGLAQSKIVNLVRDTVNSPKFYRWQALRIARTESLFAMNSAKQQSFESSSFKVLKVWNHGGSRHARPDHLEMDGKTVPSEEYFTLPSGERAMYPGDTSLSAGEVINCSCSYSYIPMRDENNNLVYK